MSDYGQKGCKIMTKKEWKRRKRRKIIAVISATIIVLAGVTALIYVAMGELKKSIGTSSKDDSLYLSVIRYAIVENGLSKIGTCHKDDGARLGDCLSGYGYSSA